MKLISKQILFHYTVSFKINYSVAGITDVWLQLHYCYMEVGIYVFLLWLHAYYYDISMDLVTEG